MLQEQRERLLRVRSGWRRNMKRTFRIDYYCGRSMQSRFWIDARTVIGAVIHGYIAAWKDAPRSTKFRSFSVTMEEEA